MNTCNECHVLKQRIDKALIVVQKYSWLLESYVLDYYVEEHWQKMPSSWQESLKDTDPQELGALINTENIDLRSKRPWPLSLLALRSIIQELSLSRYQVAENFKICQSLHCHRSACMKHRSEKIMLPALMCYNQMPTECSESKIERAFMKHVKPKKQREIKSMAKETAKIALQCNVNLVVDIGSGLGHLSRMLAYKYGLQVCCIEAQSSLSKQARALDCEMEKNLAKYLSHEEMQKLHRPVHINANIDVQFTAHSLLQELKKSSELPQEDLKFGLIGLHPCGDLAPILLKLFIDCQNASFISVVGCCYMKLSTSNDSEPKFTGYPMSCFVPRRPHILSFEAREISCHAIETYRERLCLGDYEYLKIHCFRALLEKIIVKRWPQLRHSVVKSIRHYNSLMFPEYCNIATTRLGVKIPTEDIHSEETQSCLSEWKKVVTFYTLRLMLAPLVETIILLDRLLFLQELEIGSGIIPLFDPKISPRNHILIATKH